VGPRFTPRDTGTGALKRPREAAQRDVEVDGRARHSLLSAAVHADARLALEALLALLPAERRPPWAAPPAAGDRWQLPGLDLVTPLRRVLPPDGIVVADITRLAYILLTELPLEQPRTF